MGVPGRLWGGFVALLVAFGGPSGVSLGVSGALGGIIGGLFECLGVFGCPVGVPGRLLGGFVGLFVPTGAPSSVLLAALLSYFSFTRVSVCDTCFVCVVFPRGLV